ncbi:hypothetical protein RhiirA4_458946 [Rhizophagus irregularis]|uniref:Uncharacterized protein n=1 Tax=Rhizophagus irregularis TaxID=588596 RepID=A0A2I1GDA2_9GLOM|nr:hypothetical protein RhiirA4_458946 [Rhizophagus irregularis]
MTTIDIYDEVNRLSEIDDIEKLTEKEIADLFMYFNNIDKLPNVEKVLIKSKNDKVKLIYLRNLLTSEQPVTAKRIRPSIDFLLDLRRKISADENPIILIPFITRPEIEDISALISIIISGKSGTGKTRIGFEINNIVEHHKYLKKLKDDVNAIFEHIYINMDEIKNLLGPGLDNDTKLMNNTKDYDYKEVIMLIRKEKKLDKHNSLILILQIDEFQSENYWTITLLRAIKSILIQVIPRTLIIPICTGTTPSKIANLGDSTFSISQYTMTNINLSPMNFENSTI